MDKKNWDELSDDAKREYINCIENERKKEGNSNNTTYSIIIIFGLIFLFLFFLSFMSSIFGGKLIDFDFFFHPIWYVVIASILIIIFYLKFKERNVHKEYEEQNEIIINGNNSNLDSKQLYEKLKNETNKVFEDKIITQENIIKFYNDNQKDYILYTIFNIVYYISYFFVILIVLSLFLDDFYEKIGIYSFLLNTIPIFFITFLISYFMKKRKYNKLKHYYSYKILDYSSYEDGYLFKEFLSRVRKYTFEKNNQ
jgi:hypothetical protein